MAATTSRRSRNARGTSLTSRGATVVALLASVATGTVVAAWQHGHDATVLMGALVAVLLWNGRATLAKVNSAKVYRQALRGVAWAVAAIAAYLSLNHPTGPGGAMLGLSLAAALATYLRLSR